MGFHKMVIPMPADATDDAFLTRFFYDSDGTSF